MNVRIINPVGMRRRRIYFCGDGCCSWHEFEDVEVGEEVEIEIDENGDVWSVSDDSIEFNCDANFYEVNTAWEII